jgi:membrane protein
MKASSRNIMVLASAAAVVAVVRTGLPALLTWLVNAAVRKRPGIRGKVQRMQINFLTPGVTLSGVSVAMLDPPGHRLEASVVALKGQWRDLLKGAVAASLHVNAPRLLINAIGMGGSQGGDGKKQKPPPDKAGTPWQEKIMQLPRFRISPVLVTDGAVQIVGAPGEKDAELTVDRLNLCVENITNTTALAPSLMASVTADARLLSSGECRLQAQGYPLAKIPTFNADLGSSGIDLSLLRNIIQKVADIDLQQGTAALYVEAAAADGYISGYAKPIFDHLVIAPPAQSGLLARLKVWAAKALTWLITNKRRDRIATRLDFEGAIDDPEFDTTDAVLRFIRNAFSTAERASREHRIQFFRAGKTPDEVVIRDQSEPSGRFSAFFSLAKETISRWSGDGAPRMAAALSYYTTFAMAPLLILAISIAGLLLGHDAAQGKIMEEIGGLVGTKSAAAIQDMLKGAVSRPYKGIIGSIIGIVTLLAGATGVLSELKSALNIIWRTQEPGNVKEVVKKNVLFVGMLLGIGFLMTVSLILSATLASLGSFLTGFLPAPEIVLHGIDFLISTGFVAVLFAAMYRFLPNTKIEWRDVWIGAAVTSLLFNCGKIALGLYIGKSAVASSYGAAGAILVVLLWVYYSGLIFYFGAQFTKVYSDRYGSRLKSKPIRKHSPPIRKTSLSIPSKGNVLPED